MNKNLNIICLDTETTGLSRENDEILQLSIIGGDGEILFSEYIKPSHRKQWTKAQSIHGISPADVKDCKTLIEYRPRIQELLMNADIIVGYNIMGFDLPMLFSNGIYNSFKDGSIIVDVMLAFALRYGEFNERTGDFRWQKLQTCAEYYSYKGNQWHDALDDAKATLFCFYAMFGNPPDIPENDTGVFLTVDDSAEESPLPEQPAAAPPSVRARKTKQKTGRVMIGFGVFFAFGFFVAFNPVVLVITVVLLFFGIRRHKAFKASQKENGEPE